MISLNFVTKDDNEFYEILMNNDITKSINDNMQFLLEIIPELKHMIGFEHKHPHHHLDVWEHTLYAISLSENYFDVRLALLLHDIGKPFSYQDDEVRHFHNHPNISCKMSEEILNRLNFEDEYIKQICYLIKYHDTPITDESIKSNHSIEYKRYLVQLCDALAHHPDKLEKRSAYLLEMNEKINDEKEQIKYKKLIYKFSKSKKDKM